MAGIEPASQAWEAHILPLNHTRVRYPLVDRRKNGSMQNRGQVPNGSNSRSQNNFRKRQKILDREGGTLFHCPRKGGHSLMVKP